MTYVDVNQVSDSTTLNSVSFFLIFAWSRGQNGFSLVEEVKSITRPRSLWKCRAVLCQALAGGTAVEMSLYLCFPWCHVAQLCWTLAFSRRSDLLHVAFPKTLSLSCPTETGHSAWLPQQTFTTGAQKPGHRTVSFFFSSLLYVKI